MGITRSAFLDYKTPMLHGLLIPEFGETVFVALLTASERDQFEAEQSAASKAKKKTNADLRAHLVVATTRDEAGSPLFTYEDVPAIAALPATIVEPIIELALKVNKFTSKDVEELAKNSQAGPSSDSPTV